MNGFVIPFPSFHQIASVHIVLCGSRHRQLPKKTIDAIIAWKVHKELRRGSRSSYTSLHGAWDTKNKEIQI
jgi:hypothetical protein